MSGAIRIIWTFQCIEEEARHVSVCRSPFSNREAGSGAGERSSLSEERSSFVPPELARLMSLLRSLLLRCGVILSDLLRGLLPLLRMERSHRTRSITSAQMNFYQSYEYERGTSLCRSSVNKSADFQRTTCAYMRKKPSFFIPRRRRHQITDRSRRIIDAKKKK